MNPVRLIIIDEHDMVRRALVILMSVSDSVEIVGETAALKYALPLVQQVPADVVVIEPFSRHEDIATAYERIQTLASMSNLFILSTHADYERILAAVEAGATSYLEKSVTAAALIDAIHKTAQGEGVFPASFLAADRR